MTVQSKFNVNDLLKKKFGATEPDSMQGMEVMEISSITCSAGTQVFYSCRMLIAIKKFKNKYSDEGEFSWTVSYGVRRNGDANELGWEKFREDELIEAPKEFIELLNKSE